MCGNKSQPAVRKEFIQFLSKFQALQHKDDKDINYGLEFKRKKLEFELFCDLSIITFPHYLIYNK